MQMSFRNITNDLNERNIAVIVNTATYFIWDVLENLRELHFPPYLREGLEADRLCPLEAAQQLLTVWFHLFPTWLHLSAASSDSRSQKQVTIYSK